MKVTYEFNCQIDSDDVYELKTFEKAKQMYSALTDIEEYLRSIRKGWVEDSADQMEEKISSMISDSGIHEIE